MGVPVLPSTPNDGWEETKDSTDRFRVHEQHYNPGQNPSTGNTSIRYDGPSPCSSQDSPGALSPSDTINLVRNTFDKAIQEMRQTRTGSEGAGDAVKIKLTLDLSYQNILELPNEVVGIFKADVESLMISHNQISHIPHRFSECTTLNYLNLRENRLKDFPKALYKLPNLQILDLSRNELSRIPEDIKHMKALRVLSLMNNRLEGLPFSIGFLDKLDVLKLASNPWNDGIEGVLNGSNGSQSPGINLVAEKDTQALTKKVKKYLKDEAAALESGGDSSESPLNTPRPLKRNNSIRFPVVLTANGFESAPDVKSPGIIKPPTFTRSHYRVASGQNSILMNSGLRRPGVTPLTIGSERTRSNSESVLQATANQSNRNKRMGIVTRKNPDLGTVDKTRSQRDSFHLRGFSHGSALRDKSSNDTNNGCGGSSFPASLAEGGRLRDTYVRRLSSLPEYKGESRVTNHIADGVKGVLYSLQQVHPYVSSLINVIKDNPKRKTLESEYHFATVHLEQLDKELHAFEANEDTNREPGERAMKNICSTCGACVASYQQVGKLILEKDSQFVSESDQRYIRTLNLLIFGNLIEARNACLSLVKSVKNVILKKFRKLAFPLTRQERHRYSARSATPTKERPHPARRLSNDAAVQQPRTRPRSRPHFIPISHPHPAVPLYVNGRSRSNSRANTLTTSSISSIANTPRSGESFLIPQTPQVPPEHYTQISPESSEVDQDVIFEKIYLGFGRAIEEGLRTIPPLCQYFANSFEVSKETDASRKIQGLWQRLVRRCRSYLEAGDMLTRRMATVRVKDPEARHSVEFWKYFIDYTASHFQLVAAMRDAKRLRLINLESIQHNLLPTHNLVKAANSNLQFSPWGFVLRSPSPPRPGLGQKPWLEGDPLYGHPNGQKPIGAPNRSRNESYSGPGFSHYGTSVPATPVPATPLSAALGPAAQATVPSTPVTTVAFDRSLQVDMCQRADMLLNSHLNSQNTMLHRR